MGEHWWRPYHNYDRKFVLIKRGGFAFPMP